MLGLHPLQIFFGMVTGCILATVLCCRSVVRALDRDILTMKEKAKLEAERKRRYGG